MYPLLRIFLPSLALALIASAPLEAFAQATQAQSIDIAAEHLSLLKSHQDFLERMYSISAALIGFIGLLFLGLLTFFGFRTKKQIDDMVDQKFTERVNATIRSKVNAVTEQLADEFTDKLREATQYVTDDIEGSSTEIAKIKETLTDLQSAVQDLQEKAANVPEADRIKVEQGQPKGGKERRELAWQRIEYELKNHKFVWRSIGRLALAAGTTPQEAEQILDEHQPHHVVVSTGKSGRRIARLTSRMPGSAA